MENLYGNYSNKKSPTIKYFDGNVMPISISRGRFHSPVPLSPVLDPYDSSSESPNSSNLLSPMVHCLRSGSPVPFGFNGGRRNSGGRGGFGSPLASIENLMTQPPRSPILFKTPVKVEEDVIVMDGILVKPKSGSTRSRATQTPSDPGGENSFYKRDTCWFWEECGTCRLGSKCQFAHGQEELRPARLTTKSNKSEICKSFSLGSCSYGSKCRFVHQEPEKEQGQVNSVVLSPAAGGKVIFPAKLGPVTPIVVKHPNSGGKSRTSTIASAAPASGNSGWSPLDDGIKIHLPGKAPTRENVDVYIQSVLYGSFGKTRLSAFTEFCPE